MRRNRRGIEVNPSTMLVVVLIGLMVLGVAMWWGTSFFKDVGNKVQGFQSCEAGVVSQLGGSEALCSADKGCKGLKSGVTYQNIGKGWGCEGATPYCCLGLAEDGVSEEKLREASCAGFTNGSIALIRDGRCIVEGDVPRADSALGVRIYPDKFKAPCRAQVTLDNVQVYDQPVDCGADTGYLELFDGKTGYDLLRPKGVALTTLNDGGTMVVRFTGAGANQVIERTFNLDVPTKKACDDSSWDQCKGKVQGETVNQQIMGDYQRRSCVIESGYTCKLGGAVSASGAALAYVCIDISVPSTENGIAVDETACKYMDVSPDNTKDRRCYVRSYVGRDYACVRGPTSNTCIQELIPDGPSSGYPQCKEFTQNIDMTTWLLSHGDDIAKAYFKGAISAPFPGSGTTVAVAYTLKTYYDERHGVQ